MHVSVCILLARILLLLPCAAAVSLPQHGAALLDVMQTELQGWESTKRTLASANKEQEASLNVQRNSLKQMVSLTVERLWQKLHSAGLCWHTCCNQTGASCLAGNVVVLCWPMSASSGCACMRAYGTVPAHHTYVVSCSQECAVMHT